MPAIATIYHNPRCSKSRATLALLQEREVKTTIKLYLDSPPLAGEVLEILSMLGESAIEILRTQDSEYKALGIKKDLSNKEIAELIAAHPKLLQRPIVIINEQAVIGRPPENVLVLLDQSQHQ